MAVRSRIFDSWAIFLPLLVAQLWVAHALVFFTHEYAHTVTAWLLGWKATPLGLSYPHPTLKVFLLQLGIDQNVDEAPIFASGHGTDAALIAAAGPVLGNGLVSLPLSRIAYRAVIARARGGWALLAYWCTVASVGNFIDYVPIRTFMSTGDIGSIERGFGWSPWIVLVVLGVPAFAALIWLFVRVVPATLSRLFPESVAKRALIALLTTGAMFGFYGAAGLLGGGPISHRLSLVSVFFVLPCMVIFELVRACRPGLGAMRRTR